jgi:hypothetical protein
VRNPGYALSGITTQNVTDTFNAISAYIKTKDASIVNPSDGFLGVIKMGDCVNLPSLTVASYTIAAGINITTHDDRLRLMVVGINPYYNKNNNGTNTPHLIFHFKIAPAEASMQGSNYQGNQYGYLRGMMRRYLTPVTGEAGSGNYWTGLRNAGVPENVVWPVSRRVANQGNGYQFGDATAADTIEDYLWLPTEWEMYGSNTNSNPIFETADNQGYFAYYNSNAKRKIVSCLLASPHYNSNSDYCRVSSWDGSPSTKVCGEAAACAPRLRCKVEKAR